MQLEFMLILLGVFLGIFLDMVYRALFKGKKAKKQNNSKQVNQLVDTTLEEDDWESESEEGEDGFVRNSVPAPVEEAELFANYPISNIK